MSSSTEPSAATGDPDLAAEACRRIAGLRNAEGLSDEDLRNLLAAAVRLYAERAEQERPDSDLALPPGHGLNATGVMIAASALLKAVNVQVFEFGMWQMLSGRGG
jgi:hypothetical protein